MDIELVSIDDASIEGFTSERNSYALNRMLFETGIRIAQMTIVRNNKEQIKEVLQHAYSRVSMVIITGVTNDEIEINVRVAAADSFGIALAENKEIIETIKRLYEGRGMPFDDGVKRRTLVPLGASVIKSPDTDRYGFAIEQQKRFLYVIPGNSEEATAFAREFWLAEWKMLAGTGDIFMGEIIRTIGLPPFVVQKTIDRIRGSSDKTSIGIKPLIDSVDILLSASKTTAIRSTEFYALKQRVIKELGINVYGTGNETLEGVLGSLLRERKQTIAVAESCTGGLIGDRITNIPGSSQYFMMSTVTYSNKAKMDLLGVKQEFLESPGPGAVSAEVAQAMAAGLRERAKVDFTLAVTGIADKNGETPQKLCGSVYIALAHKDGVECTYFLIHGERKTVKYIASSLALDMLRRHLMTRYGGAHA